MRILFKTPNFITFNLNSFLKKEVIDIIMLSVHVFARVSIPHVNHLEECNENCCEECVSAVNPNA